MALGGLSLGLDVLPLPPLEIRLPLRGTSLYPWLHCHQGRGKDRSLWIWSFIPSRAAYCLL